MTQQKTKGPVSEQRKNKEKKEQKEQSSGVKELTGTVKASAPWARPVSEFQSYLHSNKWNHSFNQPKLSLFNSYSGYSFVNSINEAVIC